MKIYSNKKRPVKASSNGRKWVNTELTQDEYAKFRNFLKKKGYKYETSGAGDMVHIEAYLNEAEIKEADNFLDTLDNVNGACGKKSVKADSFLRHTRKSDDGTFSYTIDENKLYYGVPGAYFVWKGEWGDPWVEYDGGVYNASDLDSGVYSDFEEYCKENGITFSDWRDEDNAFDAWAEENGRDSAEGWLYDMSPFAEVVETSGNYRWAKEIGVNASTKRRRNTKVVKASEIDELEEDPFINALWEACDDVPQLVEINYEATDGIIFIFNHTTDDYDGREASLINSLEAAGYDAEYLANNGSNVIVLDVKEKGVNASVSSRKAVKASELTDVNGYAVQIHDMHDAMYDLLLFGNREDAEWASEQLEIISNRADNGELDDYEYRDMISDVFNMSDDYIEEINFRTEIDRNNIWTAFDDSKWQIVNPVSVSLWL